MDNASIPQVEPHKDIGIILSEDLSWNRHYKFIIARAYKTLGLICRTFTSNQSPAKLVKLYASLVRSQLLYCTQLWHPLLMKDILQIQCHSTKHILNDYTSGYKERLINWSFSPWCTCSNFKTSSLQSNLSRLLLISSASLTTLHLALPTPDLVLATS